MSFQLTPSVIELVKEKVPERYIVIYSYSEELDGPHWDNEWDFQVFSDLPDAFAFLNECSGEGRTVYIIE